MFLEQLDAVMASWQLALRRPIQQLSEQPQLFASDFWRPEVREVERREFAVEAVAAGEGFEGRVDLIRADAGAFHAAAELGVVEFAGTRIR